MPSINCLVCGTANGVNSDQIGKSVPCWKCKAELPYLDDRSATKRPTGANSYPPNSGMEDTKLGMDGVDNEYIENAITALSSTVGVKEYVDSQKIVTLIDSKNIQRAIEEIAKCLGLPIKVNLSYVPKGYRPTANDGFQSSGIVKTNPQGRGTSGITAQVSIPPNLPFYGTPGMVNFPINARVSENCADSPMTFVSVMAHELSHIVLYSIWHKEKENEYYTDLTAMMLGFAEVMMLGRKVVKTNTATSFLGTTTTTNTTTYGYMSDENFEFALGKIEYLLETYNGLKARLEERIKGLENKLLKQETEILYFNRYRGYLDNHLPKKISQQDGYWITSFHRADYTDAYESTVQRIRKEFKEFTSLISNLNHYTNLSLEELKKYQKSIDSIGAEMNSKYEPVRGAVIILKKYVSIGYRFQSFLSIKLAKAK